MNWRDLTPDQKIDLIREHWMNGYSAADLAKSISARLGCDISRKAIIGVYTRNPDALKGYPLPAPPQAKKRSKQALTIKRALTSQTAPYSPIVAPQSRYVPLLDLGRNECRWPVNDASVGELHLFCACRTEIGKPYCEFHAELSVGEGTAAERRVLKVGRRDAA